MSTADQPEQRPHFDSAGAIEDCLSVIGSHGLVIFAGALVFVLAPQLVYQLYERSRPGSAPVLDGVGRLLPFLQMALGAPWSAWVSRICVMHLSEAPTRNPLGLAAQVAPRSVQIILLKFAVFISVAAACLLLVVPGIMLGIRWLVALPAMAIEDVDLPSTLGRSRDLTQGSRMAVFGLVALFTVVVLVLSVILRATIGGGLGRYVARPDIYTFGLLPLLTLATASVGAVGLGAIYVELRRVKLGTEAALAAETFS
jgi:hypothetical protein